VNFARKENQVLHLRTFERGVEAETLACGTGAVATALTQAFLDGIKGQGEYALRMPGGRLTVKYLFDGSGFSNVFLEGPAAFVFSGELFLASK
jgi:diaminopimelate epimerase